MRNLNWPVVIARYKELMKDAGKRVIYFSHKNFKDFDIMPREKIDESFAGYVPDDNSGRIFINKDSIATANETIQHEVGHILLHKEYPQIDHDSSHQVFLNRAKRELDDENEVDILTFSVYGFPDVEWKMNHVRDDMKSMGEIYGISRFEYLAMWDAIVAHGDFPVEWRNAYLKKYRNVATRQPKVIQHKQASPQIKHNVEQRMISQ